MNVAFNQTVRSNLVERSKAREANFRDVAFILYDAEAAFPKTALMNVPAAIPKPNSKFQTYSKPDDTIENTLREVRTKYELTDADISK